MKNACGWDKWKSEGIPEGTPSKCAACGLHRTYGDVRRCFIRGEHVVATAATDALTEAEIQFVFNQVAATPLGWSTEQS